MRASDAVRRYGPYVGVAVVAWCAFWSQARLGLFPPDSDLAYYMLGARSLRQGRGFAVDVVWNFAVTTPTMPQPGFELWMPGTSLTIAMAQRLLGESYAAACGAASVFGAVAVVLCVVVAERMLGNRALALACGGLFVLNERLMLHASSPDSTIFYVVWVLGTLIALDAAVGSQGRSRVAWFSGAGAMAAAATLTRNDALVALPLTFALLGIVWRRGEPGKRLSWRDVAVTAGAFAFCLAPWSVRNLTAFGTPWAPASSKTLWLTSYHDLFQFPFQSSASAYARHLVAAPWEVLSHKAQAIYRLLYWTADLVHIGAIPFAIGGAVIAASRSKRLAWSGVAFLTALLVALGLGADRLVSGGSHRSLVPLLPFMLAFVLTAAESVLMMAFRGERAGTGRRLAAVLGGVLAAGVWALVLGSTVLRLSSPEVSYFEFDHAKKYRAAAVALSAAGLHGPVLAIRPAMASYGMDRPSIMIPTAGLNAVCSASREFGANAMLLNGYYLNGPGYEEVSALYRRRLEDRRMQPIWASDQWVIFRLHCDRGTASTAH